MGHFATNVVPSIREAVDNGQTVNVLNELIMQRITESDRDFDKRVREAQVMQSRVNVLTRYHFPDTTKGSHYIVTAHIKRTTHFNSLPGVNRKAVNLTVAVYSTGQ